LDHLAVSFQVSDGNAPGAAVRPECYCSDQRRR
jgi:hypothetical protein